MEHGPLPPHERQWRHPSELAAEEQAALRAEAVHATARTFAITTGTLGLVAIAVLALTVTPSRQQPVAVSATTAPTAIVPAGDAAPLTVVSARRSGPGTIVQAGIHALATPIGSGEFAVVSRAALADVSRTSVAVVLPSGRTTVGHLVSRTDDTVLVRLIDAEPGHEIAQHRPHDREVVTVMTEPPITIAFADLESIEVDEGTAVIDESGALVALCTRAGRDSGIGLILIDPALVLPHDDEHVAAGEPAPETPAGEPHDDDPAESAVIAASPPDTSDHELEQADDRTETSEPETSEPETSEPQPEPTEPEPTEPEPTEPEPEPTEPTEPEPEPTEPEPEPEPTEPSTPDTEPSDPIDAGSRR